MLPDITDVALEYVKITSNMEDITTETSNAMTSLPNITYIGKLSTNQIAWISLRVW